MFSSCPGPSNSVIVHVTKYVFDFTSIFLTHDIQPSPSTFDFDQPAKVEARSLKARAAGAAGQTEWCGLGQCGTHGDSEGRTPPGY